MVSQPPKYYDDTEIDPWLRSLLKLAASLARQGWCYQHVQALVVALDQTEFLNSLLMTTGCRTEPTDFRSWHVCDMPGFRS